VALFIDCREPNNFPFCFFSGAPTGQFVSLREKARGRLARIESSKTAPLKNKKNVSRA